MGTHGGGCQGRIGKNLVVTGSATEGSCGRMASAVISPLCATSAQRKGWICQSIGATCRRAGTTLQSRLTAKGGGGKAGGSVVGWAEPQRSHVR